MVYSHATKAGLGTHQGLYRGIHTAQNELVRVEVCATKTLLWLEFRLHSGALFSSPKMKPHYHVWCTPMLQRLGLGIGLGFGEVSYYIGVFTPHKRRVRVVPKMLLCLEFCLHSGALFSSTKMKPHYHVWCTPMPPRLG